MRVVSNFGFGVKSFINGGKLLKNNRDLSVLAVIPVFLSLLIFTTGLTVGVMYLDEILSFIIKENLNDYNFAVKGLIYSLSFMLLVFLLYFIVFIIVSLLSIPVCTSISNRILIQKNYLPATPQNIKETAITFLKMLRASIAKMVLMVIISSLIVVASIFPFLSPIAVYLSLMVLAFDCLDFSMENDNQSLTQRLQFLRRNLSAISGLAACMGVLLFVPLIHFILLPVAVAGAAELYGEIQKSEKGIL